MHGPWLRSCCVFELSCPWSKLQCRESASRIAKVLDSKFVLHTLRQTVSSLPQSSMNLQNTFVQEQVESLGPVVGPLLFVLTMASAEMIPLFPTQPLSLASGLLFGPVQV